MLRELLSRILLTLRLIVGYGSLIGTIHNRIHYPSLTVFELRLMSFIILVYNIRFSLLVVTYATSDERWIRHDFISKGIYHLTPFEIAYIIACVIFVIGSELFIPLFFCHDMYKNLISILYDLINRNVNDILNTNKLLSKSVHTGATISLSHPIASLHLFFTTFRSAFTKGTFADGKTKIRSNTRLRCKLLPIEIGRQIRIQIACVWFFMEVSMFEILLFFFVCFVLIAFVSISWEGYLTFISILDFVTLGMGVFIILHTCFLILFILAHIYTTVCLLYKRLNRCFDFVEQRLRANNRSYSHGIVYFLSHHTKLTSFLLRTNRSASITITLATYTYIPINAIIVINFIIGRYQILNEVIVYGGGLVIQIVPAILGISGFIYLIDRVHGCACHFVGVEIRLGKSVSLVTRLKLSFYYERLHNNSKMAVHIYGIGTITRENLGAFIYFYFAFILYLIQFLKD